MSHPESPELKTIAVQHPDQRLRVYFQDESRFGQQGTTANLWAQKGSRPTAVRQTEYEYLGHYLKSHFWSNRAYQDDDVLEEAAMAAWQRAVLDTQLMKTVCAAPYLKHASSD